MNLNDITETTRTSLAELLELEGSLKERQEKSPELRFAYRGQPREYKSLDPSLTRQVRGLKQGDPVRTAIELERRQIVQFRELYAALKGRSRGMPVPGQLAENFELRCLSVMQHYEIPTRLLDWSSDFWTAVYFACASEPGQDAELWYYDRRLFFWQREDASFASLIQRNEKPSPEPRVLNRTKEKLLAEIDLTLTPRMTNQVGHHTVCSDIFADHAELLIDLLQRAKTSGAVDVVFRRVIISGACKENVLKDLAQRDGAERKTAWTLFPDLVGVGRFLKWQFDLTRTLME